MFLRKGVKTGCGHVAMRISKTKPEKTHVCFPGEIEYARIHRNAFILKSTD